MDEHSKLRTVSVKLSLSEHYLVGRMLMLREKLSAAQWQVYDRSAEAVLPARRQGAGSPAPFRVAASTSRARAGRDLAPVFRMISARWFSAVGGLAPLIDGTRLLR